MNRFAFAAEYVLQYFLPKVAKVPNVHNRSSPQLEGQSDVDTEPIQRFCITGRSHNGSHFQGAGQRAANA